MIVHGKSGHGKTEYIAKLCKMFAMNYGKVNLNQVEQGKSKTFKTAAQRNNYAEMMQDTKTRGKFTMADPSQRIFDVWFERLCTRNSGRVIVLDSLDYMKLTVEQFKKMHEKFKLKGIVVVCWDDPWDPNAKRIKYMCDIKVKVHNFRAKIISRYGGNKTFVIWDNPHDVNYDSKQQEKIDDKYKSEYVEEEEEGITEAGINKEAEKVTQ
jgi:predicted DNA-binding WGR domain protein